MQYHLVALYQCCHINQTIKKRQHSEGLGNANAFEKEEKNIIKFWGPSTSVALGVQCSEGYRDITKNVKDELLHLILFTT